MSEEAHVRSLQDSECSSYRNQDRIAHLKGGTDAGYNSFASDTSSGFPFPLAPLAMQSSAGLQSEPMTSFGPFAMSAVGENASLDVQLKRPKPHEKLSNYEPLSTPSTISTTTMRPSPGSTVRTGKSKLSLVTRLRSPIKSSVSFTTGAIISL